ncbi:MAG: hypothetical protein AB8I08_29220 [Sandaracinaceae bacterium]
MGSERASSHATALSIDEAMCTGVVAFFIIVTVVAMPLPVAAQNPVPAMQQTQALTSSDGSAIMDAMALSARRLATMPGCM